MNPSVPSNWISPASIWAINSSKAPDSLTASIETNAASFSAIAEASTICWSPCSKSIVITAFLSLFLSADKDSYTICEYWKWLVWDRLARWYWPFHSLSVTHYTIGPWCLQKDLSIRGVVGRYRPAHLGNLIRRLSTHNNLV